MTETAETTGARDHGLRLREPAHRVSPRAVPYWTVQALIVHTIVLAVASTVYFTLLPERWWWTTVIYGLLALQALVDVLVKPRVRYAVHRWEVTPTAVVARRGWLTREQRIAPLSRVQTVDSLRGALMRMFDLASITVTTASAAGPVSIDCVDSATAERVVAELTEITGRDEGDAT
ncbi:PH domain-containing protein [Ornithinicoccus halotolerans]|uniref:PH domain-containing protein n=1 Tax=Ornithinicoccus halotolerans TaxID=1748220 RepID=UPI00129501CF|nr:PH domain-containing protein [Ornithinicoccus halotolerans]